MRDARQGVTSLLPGKLPFGHRPPLPIRIFTQLAIPGGEDQRVPGRKKLLSRMQHLHISLLIPILICTYVQGQLLGLGRFGALLAPMLLGVFPWFGFYVQSGFADIIRTAITTLALTLILAHMVTKRTSYLVMGGIVGGFAILSRVSTYHILLVATGIIVVGAWMDHRASPTRVRLIRSVGPGLLLAGLLSLVVTPQLIRNANDGHGWRIAANTWRQLEFGIKRLPPSAPAEMKELYTQKTATRHYLQGHHHIEDPELRAKARSYPAREQRAKERTLEFIRSLPVTTLVTRQTEKWIEFWRFRNLCGSFSGSPGIDRVHRGGNRLRFGSSLGFGNPMPFA